MWKMKNARSAPFRALLYGFLIAGGVLYPDQSWAACEQSDLVGRWEFHLRVFSARELGTASCTVRVLADSSIKSGTKCLLEEPGDDFNWEVKGKRLIVKDQCRVKGIIRIKRCSFVIENAWMAKNKNVVAGFGHTCRGSNRINFDFTALKR
ncbi:MAG: hypothetical protein OEM59_18350 [Rhodospirillales bacterium]|nr:hypothetical protein [Rhodospirillales bacterium]